MSKKNPSKQAQQLSPENYIRQKARKLPIYECMVNTDWEKSKMVNVMVARVHTNGNITAGFFLVDLLCLGVKNTTYMFNYTLLEYKEQIKKMVNIEIEPISYELAHNIVFAGLDYAAELGLNPHKEFTSLTRFILEEDTEEVELIDIECGRNGRPMYMQGQYDSEQMVKRVMAQLERSVGKDNFDIALDFGEENGDKYDDDDFEDEHDEFSELTFDEKHALFLRLLKSMEEPNDEDHKKLSDLIIFVFKDLIDKDLSSEPFDIYFENLNVEILPIEEIPFELWGVEPGSLIITDKISDLFIEAYQLVNESTKKASKKVKELKKIVGDIPAVRLLELMILQVDDKDEERLEMILDNTAKFPTYPLFQLQMFMSGIEGVKIPVDFRKTLPSLDNFFENRSSLYEIEFMNYLLVLIILIDDEANATKLEALQWAIDELELPERIDQEVFTQIMAIKFKMVAEYFLQKK